ncbi:MAG: glycosyltransferase family 39 protein [Candidatus Omnitrophota bacterium]
MNKKILLYVILMLAFFVRIVGLDFGLPFTYHDDEPIIVNYALSYGTGDLSPHTFNVPPFLSYLLCFQYGIFYLLGRLFGAFKSINDFGYLFLNNPTIFYLIGRFTLGVIPGVLSVFFIYLLGKKVFNRDIGLIAALFLAFNFLHARDSHYIYLDVPLMMVLTLLYLKSMDLIRTNSTRYYICVGVLTGIATAIKYFGPALGPFLIAVFAHNFIVYKDQIRKNLLKSGLFIVAAIATFYILNPYALLEHGSFLAALTRMPLGARDALFHIKFSLIGSMGLLMLCCSILGICTAFIKKNKNILLLSVFIFSYYLIIMMKSQAAERYVMPLLPLLLLSSAYFVYTAVSFLKRPIIRKMALISVSCVLVVPSAQKLVLADRLFLRDDTRTKAYAWVKENVLSGSVVAVDALSSGFPRLEKEKSQIREVYSQDRDITFDEADKPLDLKKRLMLSNPDYPKDTYHIYYMRGTKIRGFHSVYPDILFDFDELKHKGVDYVIISTALGDKKYRGFLKTLKSNSVLVKAFSPYAEGITRYSPEEKTSLPAAAFSLDELKNRTRFGPHIEIYKIRQLERSV